MSAKGGTRVSTNTTQINEEKKIESANKDDEQRNSIEAYVAKITKHWFILERDMMDDI